MDIDHTEYEAELKGRGLGVVRKSGLPVSVCVCGGGGGRGREGREGCAVGGAGGGGESKRHRESLIDS